MKFNLPVSLIEYKLDKVEWFDSVHGWPAVRLHVSEARWLEDVQPRNPGTFTMAIHDVMRIMRDVPFEKAEEVVWSSYDQLTQKVVIATQPREGQSQAGCAAIAEVVKRLRASGISDDTIAEWLMEPAGEVVS